MDKIASNAKNRRPLKALVIIAMLLVVYFIGIGVGSASKDNPTPSAAPAVATSAAPAQPQTNDCMPNMGQIKYNGTCQPVIKGMSCTSIQGESFYTCTANLYDRGTKLLTCDQVGTTANCY